MKIKKVIETQIKQNKCSTVYEHLMKKFLDKHGIEYIQNYPVDCGRERPYMLDLYLVGMKCYIEVDGKHHWNSFKHITHDRVRAKLVYEQTGFTEVRIRNFEVPKLTKDKLFKLIRLQKKKYKLYGGPVTLAQKVMKNKQRKSRMSR